MDTSTSSKVQEKRTITVGLNEFLSGDLRIPHTLLGPTDWEEQIKECLKILRPYLDLLPHIRTDDHAPLSKSERHWQGAIYLDKSVIGDIRGVTGKLERARLLPIATLFFREEQPPSHYEFVWDTKAAAHVHDEKYLLLMLDETWVQLTRRLSFKPQTPIGIDYFEYKILEQNDLHALLSDSRFGFKILCGLKDLLRTSIREKRYHLETLESASGRLWNRIGKIK
jgi:hypothetical protein